MSENGNRRGRGQADNELDMLDRALISLLQEDGRMSFPDIGKRLGVSANTARARFNQLKEKGAVQVVAFPDSAFLELGFHAVLGLRLSPGTAKSVAGALAPRPEIGWIGLLLTGGFDVMFELSLRDNAAFGEYKKKMFEDMPEITAIETFLVSGVSKFHYALGISPDSGAGAK